MKNILERICVKDVMADFKIQSRKFARLINCLVI
jgi:hypothetical protein